MIANRLIFAGFAILLATVLIIVWASYADRGDCLERGPPRKGLMLVGKVLLPHTYSGRCLRWEFPEGRS